MASREASLEKSTPEQRDLHDPSLFINRELSQVEFNRRVFEQARDPAVPLLERLRFLTICCTNLDEFFEIRVAGLQQQAAYGLTERGPDGIPAVEALELISEAAHGMVREQYRLLNEELLPALEQEDIRIIQREDWDERQQRWIKRYFRNEVLPVIAPIGLDPAHPFPRILNKSLNFIVEVDGKDAFGRLARVAVVQAPRSLPRLIVLPRRIARGPYDFVLLSSIVHAHVGELFPGMKVKGCYQFRLTRNSDLWVEEEEVDDLLHALKGELTSRNYGDGVRLEVEEECSSEMAAYLLRNFSLQERDLYRVDGSVNLGRLSAMYELVSRPDLKYATFVPGLPRGMEPGDDLFTVLAERDLLLHHPYQSFKPVVDFLQQAAGDPHVLAIKQTLYRTGADSPMVAALIEAARSGKEVTVVVELRARFDEAANIDLATRLQEAGAKVVYGIVGYKAHAKMLLVVRREGQHLARYVHLGTGNYHTGTARAYTDLSFFTSDRDLAEDVHRVFLQLTALGRVARLKRILQSPFTLQKGLLERIEAEAEAARRGEAARIVAKMNSLSDPIVIRALYRASQAGVPIDLVVRGICCLRPGVPGVSENIRVRSIIGRFLEHSRVFHFHAGGDELVYCSSADWMERNLYRRVETCFPIEERELRERVMDEVLEVYLADNQQAWELAADGTYGRLDAGGSKPISAQRVLLQTLAEVPGEE